MCAKRQHHPLLQEEPPEVSSGVSLHILCMRACKATSVPSSVESLEVTVFTLLAAKTVSSN